MTSHFILCFVEHFLTELERTFFYLYDLWSSRSVQSSLKFYELGNSWIFHFQAVMWFGFYLDLHNLSLSLSLSFTYGDLYNNIENSKFAKKGG